MSFDNGLVSPSPRLLQRMGMRIWGLFPIFRAGFLMLLERRLQMWLLQWVCVLVTWVSLPWVTVQIEDFRGVLKISKKLVLGAL